MTGGYHAVAILGVLTMGNSHVKGHAVVISIVRLNCLGEHVATHIVMVRGIEYNMDISKWKHALNGTYIH